MLPSTYLDDPQSIHASSSRWFRCDFHVHGPKSPDYGNKTDTPKQWLRAAISAGLDCVAITDHNSGEWVDDLKSALEELREREGVKLVLFPGVELTVETGWHLLVLFDPSKNRDHVKSFISVAGIVEGNHGQTDVQAQNIGHVLETARKYEGICIPAHANDTKGLLLQDSGTYKKDVVNNLLLHGAELREFSDCANHESERNSGDPTRIAAAQILYEERLSTLKDYTKTRNASLALLRLSDNPDANGHGLAGIGRQSTWVKMSRPDKEGLRLALHDGLMCCEFHDASKPNLNEVTHPVIKSVSVEKAYVAGLREPLTAHFSPWLTTVIGGRGSGKSTIVECLRIGLRRDSELERFGDASSILTAFRSFNSVYDKSRRSGALRANTQITIRYAKDGRLYEIGWSQDGTAVPIQEVKPDGTKAISPGDPASRFQVSLFSQRQIYEIAQNPAALLDIIDQAALTDYREFNQKWEESTLRFLTCQARIRELKANQKEIVDTEGTLQDVNVKIALHEDDQNKQVRQAWQRASQQRHEISAIAQSLESRPESLKRVALELSAPMLNVALWYGGGSQEKIRAAHQVLQSKLAEISSQILTLATYVESAVVDYQAAVVNSGWQAEFDAIDTTHTTLVADLLSRGVANAAEYEPLLARRRELEMRLAVLKQQTAELPNLEKQSAKLREDLLEMRKDRTDKRRRFIGELAGNLTTVKIEIQPFGDMDSWEQQLRDLLHAPVEFESTLTPDRIDSENAARPPRSANIVERVFQSAVQSDKRLDKVHEIQDLLREIHSKTKSNILNGHFENRVCIQQPETIDRILFTYPEDLVRVKYQTLSGKWEPISSGSPGQKTAAILAFLLAYGTEPLVIDQPEDDLDNTLIYRLVVEQIKENKRHRQLIVVTHNPNIPVNGDSELVVVMEPIPGGFAVGSFGGLQEKGIRHQICDIMEGGEDAFKKRYGRIIGASLASA